MRGQLGETFWQELPKCIGLPDWKSLREKFASSELDSEEGEEDEEDEEGDASEVEQVKAEDDKENDPLQRMR